MGTANDDGINEVNGKRSAYLDIVKGTSIFGGVQVFQIVILLLRSKFIALLLGPEGMGINGLLNSTTGLISGFSNLGLSTSAIKNIASAHASGDQKRVAMVITVFRRLVWITGAIGALAVLVLSSWLSRITFGNGDYTFAFAWISATLLLNQLSNGQLALLQGMRKLGYLAKANLSGSLLGLITAVPIYYFFGLNGIVPAIIIGSLLSLARSWYFARKVKIKPVRVDRETTMSEGKSMLRMGFLISLSSSLSLLSFYLVRIFIRESGGIAEVGLYSAGIALINNYVGLIFNAMGTDYYPRLSAVAHDHQLSKRAINQQGEIALLVLAPIVIVLLVFIRWVVIILFSGEFTLITGMISWAALGMFFKAASWAISYLLLAKGASTLYMRNELASVVYFLALNLAGYHFMGLTGLGISLMTGYIIYLIQYYHLSRKRFEFSYGRAFIRIFIIQFFLAVICFAGIRFLDDPYTYIAGSVIITISCLFSYRELDRRIGIKATLAGLKTRLRKH